MLVTSFSPSRETIHLQCLEGSPRPYTLPSPAAHLHTFTSPLPLPEDSGLKMSYEFWPQLDGDKPTFVLHMSCILLSPSGCRDIQDGLVRVTYGDKHIRVLPRSIGVLKAFSSDGPCSLSASAECSAPSSQPIRLVGLRTCLGVPAHPGEGR